MKFSPESSGMQWARRWGFEKLAWSLRRFYCPAGKNDLVLEVGSGGNPYHRANVLLDAYEATRERHWAPLISDRPTVLGLVESLPFKDGAFDFVIASHVLEHSTDPAKFLNELQRVAKAGYIEVPDAFMERINPYKDHRLEITIRNDRLVIRKKPDWRTDPELVELYESRAKKWVTRELIPSRPFDFHVRFYWDRKIDFEILNPEVDAAWKAPVEGSNAPVQGGGTGWREKVRTLTRKLFSQTQRNQELDWQSLLQCPTCKSTDIGKQPEALVCNACHQVFPMVKNVPQMFPRS